MEACADIQRQAVDDALENGQIAAFTLMKVLPWALRIQISARLGRSRPSAPGPPSSAPSKTARGGDGPGRSPCPSPV